MPKSETGLTTNDTNLSSQLTEGSQEGEDQNFDLDREPFVVFAVFCSKGFCFCSRDGGRHSDRSPERGMAGHVDYPLPAKNAGETPVTTV